VDEYIIATIALDETVAFATIEPFDCTGDSFRYVKTPLFMEKLR